MARDLDDPHFSTKGKGRASEEVQKAEAGRLESVNGANATELLLEQVMQSERAQQSVHKSNGSTYKDGAVPPALLNTGSSSVMSGPHASRVTARSSVSATHSGSSVSCVSKPRLFDLSFRPAALDLLDSDTLVRRGFKGAVVPSVGVFWWRQSMLILSCV